MKKECRNRREWNLYVESDPSTKKVVVFTTTWSAPCRFMEPYLNRMVRKRPDLTFVFGDADNLEFIAEKEVFELPTILFMKDGQTVYHFSGADDGELEQMFNNF
ncbi:thioredoxin H-type 1-like [Diospyros lotus]|uniref:thioredoxin H-type 1-like n=1 Tax=Diospyros lotus TaxID=55363 RepID=UPI00224EB697|nr:thioredoxin H-type 1-like [Diospyros lotus]